MSLAASTFTSCGRRVKSDDRIGCNEVRPGLPGERVWVHATGVREGWRRGPGLNSCTEAPTDHRRGRGAVPSSQAPSLPTSPGGPTRSSASPLVDAMQTSRNAHVASAQ